MTVIRSAVIELGIRQIQAKLQSPDISGFTAAEKAQLAMGQKAEEAAARASEQWVAFAEHVRALQEDVLRTSDSFDKVLNDAIAWEETLPSIASNQQQVSQSGQDLINTQAGMLGTTHKLGSSVLLLARGLMFLTGAERADTKVLLEKLFVIQGVIDVTKAGARAHRALAGAINLSTAASRAFIAANAPLLVIGAAIAGALWLVNKALKAKQAQYDALKTASEEYLASQQAVIEANKLEAEFGASPERRQELIEDNRRRIHNAELMAAQAKDYARMMGLTEHEIAAQQQLAELSQKMLDTYRDEKSVKADIAAETARVADIEIKRLQTIQQQEKIERQRAASLQSMSGGDRSKLRRVLSVFEQGGAGAWSKQQAEFAAQSRDERLRLLGEAEQARRWRQDPLEQRLRALPISREEAETKEIENWEKVKTDAQKRADEAMKEVDSFASKIIQSLRKHQAELDRIRGGAQSQSQSRWGPG